MKPQPTPFAAYLLPENWEILSNSVSTYRRSWQLYRLFLEDKLKINCPIFPISTDNMALFIAFLAEQKYAPSTVIIYISSLGFPHRLAGLPDPTKVDMIQLTLRAYSSAAG